ncbi:MAG: DUF4062 domain-containing protein [Nocardioidaceae bacterium]|nr:DUF4062 domain-containing protein [Nocardioidaceae bacterium]MDN5792506.1 DUF4062 domain-containing protein [Brevibacterium aurantiacum]
MAIEKREQVFISSTFKDLVDERRAVIQTLLQADCIPSGMELFPASDTEKFDLIKGVIDLCDYYVVIVGGRYGSVDAEQQLSYTEMEFDYAVKTRIPVMGFLHGDPGKLIGDKLELDPDLRVKLDEFRAKVEAKMVKYWHVPGDLPAQVALAIMQIRKSHPAVGWIRASQAMTPEVKAELVELRAKVRELSADLKDEQRHHSEQVDPAELQQGDAQVEIKCIVDYHWQETIDAKEARQSNRERSWLTLTPTWNELFKHLGPDLMDEASEESLIERLSDMCLDLAREDLLEEDEDFAAKAVKSAQKEKERQASRVGGVYEAEVALDSFNDVKVQFSALGLIEKGSRRRPASDYKKYWLLTTKGDDLLMRIRAIREPTAAESARG